MQSIKENRDVKTLRGMFKPNCTTSISISDMNKAIETVVMQLEQTAIFKSLPKPNESSE